MGPPYLLVASFCPNLKETDFRGGVENAKCRQFHTLALLYLLLAGFLFASCRILIASCRILIASCRILIALCRIYLGGVETRHVMCFIMFRNIEASKTMAWSSGSIEKVEHSITLRLVFSPTYVFYLLLTNTMFVEVLHVICFTMSNNFKAVSYTHLTLPTIYSV